MVIATKSHDVGSVTPPPRPSPLLRLSATKFPPLPQAVEAMALGLVVSDATRPDMPIVYCNPGFERLTGYTFDEVVGRNCRFLQGPDTAGRELDKLREALRAGKACSVVLRNYRKDHTPFWNALNVTPMADAAGRVTHFVGVQTDITHVKELEAQLFQSQKMEVVGRLTGGVAHDFNNLITAITGFTETALETIPATDPAHAMLKEVVAAGERAAGLTRQLLAFSRKGAKGASADLNHVVSGCAGMLRRLLGRGVELVVRHAPELKSVAADPGQLEQVLLNLAVNARDAMPAGGRLTIETALLPGGEGAPGHPAVVPGTFALIRVEDTGHGMDAATLARVFEPFFTTKPAGRGTGLGLSTVTGIVRECGGYIRVESEPGRGTVFFVYLPTAAAPRAEPAPALAEEHRLRGSEVVLVVDSDDAVRAVLGLALRSRGYTVLEAASASEALGIARDHPGPIDLVISDALVAGAGTGAFLASVRGTKPGVRTLSVSGYLPDDDASGAAATHFLAKPFSPLSLVVKVRQVMDARPGEAGSPCRLGPARV